MFIGPFYSLVAACLFTISWWIPNVLLTLLFSWCAAAFFAVSIAYWRNQPRLFRKRQSGQLPRISQWVFAPFFTFTHLYNRWARKRDVAPPVQQVAPGLYVGARLTYKDIPDLQTQGIDGILDVTAEFESVDRFTQSQAVAYLSVPVLDHAYPSRSQLMRALQWLHQQRQAGHKVVVHCALGRGRSVMVVAAYLWALSPHHSLEDVLGDIKMVRPKAHLNQRQRRALVRFQQSGALRLARPIAWIIANPAAGGKKWRKHRDYIQAYLGDGYRLVVHQTRHNRRSYQLACRAVSQQADVVIAAGGDGTVNAVARALINTAIPLGVLPLGTANALCHALWGIKTKFLNIDAACDVILDGTPRTIDTARCNGKVALLVVGVGFEQQMIRHAAREQKNQLGQWAYLQGLLGAASQNQAIDLTVKFDHQAPQLIRTTSMVVANAAPMTTLLAQGQGQPNYADGKLDVTWLTASSTKTDTALSLMELAFASLFETRLGRFTHYQQVTRVSIRATSVIDYVIDGELYRDRKLTIDAQPQSLAILSPPLPDAAQSDDNA
ncbi:MULTISPECIES: diacylglycerol kinase family protein [unclassified Salinivibrio]|uniref:diacylglycerol kinase family protein n=1 Tax=unclassified Salinivibrio TaxID=2636825 RepID=UPI00128C76B8